MNNLYEKSTSFKGIVTALLSLAISLSGTGLLAQTFPMPTGFTLPAGKTIVITYDVDVNGDACPAGTVPPANISNQATVSGSNIGAPKLTNDPDNPAPDPAPTLTPFGGSVLGNLVYNDVNRNGVFDAGDSGINSVAVNLYLDNGDNMLTGTDGAAIASTTTAGGGLYSFNVCPGNYIVEIAPSNFTGAGALANGGSPFVTSPLAAAGDPDTDIDDNDDNGDFIGGSFGVASLAVNISSGETENKVDFGFKTPATITINDVSMAEGTGGTTTSFDFIVTRSSTEDAISLTVNTSNGSAGGSDFTAISGGTVSFIAGGSNTATVSVLVNHDNMVEPDETFTVNLSGAPPHATITDGTGQGIILNDDTDVTVAVSPSQVLEDGATNLVYTFTRTGVTTGALTVNFLVGGTATFNTDYTQTGAATFDATMGTVTFGAGNATATVTVDPTADSPIEPDETVILTVTTGSGYNVASPNDATGTITNDDADVSVAVSPSSVSEDGATNLVYTFTRTGFTAGTLTVNFSVGGTAAFNTDYTQTGAATFNATMGTVTFGAGNSTATVTVDPTADTPVEPDETVILTLTSGTGYNVVSPNEATGTINNDDTDVTVAVSPTSTAEDGAANLVYTFTRTGVTTGALTVNFSVGGTATFNTDYTQTGAATFTATMGTVTFGAGNSTATVTIDPTADMTVEPDETVILTVTTGTGYNVASPDIATGTITNDDTDVSVAVAPASVFENGFTNLTYTFTRTGVTTGALTVNFSVGGTATFNTDYTQSGAATFNATTGTVTFGAGNSTAAVTVDPTGDMPLEPDETVILTVTTGTGYNVGSPSIATGTITNDDQEVSVSVSPPSVLEDGSTNLEYTFTRTGYTVDSVTVFISVGGTATLTTDYTQSGAALFTGTSGWIHFTFNQTSKVVTIDPVVDMTAESDETVVLTINPAIRYNVGSPNSATGTIEDDDNSVSVNVSPASTAEDGAGTMVYTFTRTDVNSGALVVNFSVGGTATLNTDYTQTGATTFNATMGTVTFSGVSPTATVTIDPSSDLTVEPDETVILTVTSGTGYGVGSPDMATGTITNDDTDVSVAVSPSSVLEDGATNLVYTFTRMGVTTGALTVNFSVDGTATFNTDYTQTGAATFNATTGTVMFGAGNSTATVTVDPSADLTVEPDETIVLTVTSGTGYNVASPSSATSTISNDDTDVTVAVSPTSVNEDGAANLVYTFTRMGVTTGALTVNFSVDGTATFNTDYTQTGAATFNATMGTVTFGAGNSTATVTVDPSADLTVEPDETVILTVTTGTGYNVASPSSATGTITNDDTDVSVAVLPTSTAEDGAANLVYTFTRMGFTTGALTVNFMVDGTATFNTDYTQTGAATFNATMGTVTFGAGNSTATVTVDPSSDMTVELDETVVLTVTSGTGYNVASPSSATGTITNDDAEVAVSVSSSSVNEDGAANLVYTFTRTGFQGSALTVGFNVGGTATFATDYSQTGASTFTATMGTVAIGSGIGMATVTVDPTADLIVEPNETVILTVVNGTGYIAGSPGSATGTINNDELDYGDAPDPTYPTLLASTGARHMTIFGLSLGANIDGDPDGQSTATANGDDTDAEGDDDDGVMLPAQLIATTNANITVNASANGKLDAWIDFNGNGSWADAGEQVFTNQALVPGNNSLTIVMPVMVAQGTSFARFRFSTAGGLSYTGLAADGEVEDYQVELVNTQFSIDDPTVAEGNAGTTSLTFNVSRSTNANTCSVQYAITGGTAQTSGTSNTGGNDYQPLALGTVNFTAGGDFSMPVTVTVNGDQTVELNETVVMTLSNPVSGNILDGEGTGTITNDDAATITISSPSIAEGDNGNTTLTFDIAMSNPSDANVSFNFGTADGTATVANSDYIGIGGSQTLAPGEQNKQVFQAVVGDCTIEPDEAFSVVLSSLSNSGRNVSFSGGGATLNGTGTILNDDALPVITCSNDFSQNTDAGVCQATVMLPQPNSSSVCGSSTLEFRYRPVNAANQPTGAFSNYAPAASNTVVFQKGKYEMEWRITDGSGSSVCSHFLTVVDAEAPVAVCKNITVQLSMSGTAVITPSQVDNGSSDNCAFTLSLNTTTFSCANVGPNTVMLTATDPGNLTHSCNATVTVEDKVNPIALCKNVTVQLDANGNGTITASQVNNGSSDACGIQSLSVTPYIFSCANVGANTVTLTVMDVNNNQASCNATVTVEDKVKPAAICQNITITLNADGTKTVSPSQINNGSNDACGIAGMSLFPNVFSCNHIGVNTTTLTVTDVNGNTNTCTATVTVNEFVVITNVSTTPESCTGTGDGTITIEATTLGGVLQYSINGGATYSYTNIFTGLPPGTYNIKVRAQGTANCGDTATATVGTASGGAQTWYKDWDNDGYSDGTTQVSCTQPNGYKLPANLTATSGDCNDNDPQQFPGQTWYKDSDNDGYSDGTILMSCTKPVGYKAAAQLVQTSGDCNDSNAAIRPGATETCNGIDDNCNSQIDEGLADLVYNGNVVLTTQAQVNAFSQCYTVINGNLTVQNAGISNINTLSNIHKVTGYVLIKQTSLTSLVGLSSLDTVGGNLTINNNIYGSKLNTLDGLENLARVGGNLAIFSNLKLSDCCAIHDLLNTPSAIGGSISIFSNLTGCESLSGINTACGAPNSLAGPVNINLWVDILFDKQGSAGVFSMYDAGEDQINMTIKGQFSNGVAKLFDHNGRMVLRQNFQPGNTWFRMMLGQTVPGNYQLEISLDGNVYTKALVIE